MIDEMPSCYTRLNPKARKPHRCCECWGIIRPGEKYHIFSGVWGGEASTYKTCAECDALRAELNARPDHKGYDSIPFEGLCEEVQELGGDHFLRFANTHIRRHPEPTIWIIIERDRLNDAKELSTP